MEALTQTSNNEARIFFSTVTNLSQHFEPHPVYRKKAKTEEEELVSRKIVSNIVTASVLSNGKTRKVNGLNKDVFITFTHETETLKGMSNPQCSWWNEDRMRVSF